VLRDSIDSAAQMNTASVSGHELGLDVHGIAISRDPGPAGPLGGLPQQAVLYVPISKRLGRGIAQELLEASIRGDYAALWRDQEHGEYATGLDRPRREPRARRQRRHRDGHESRQTLRAAGASIANRTRREPTWANLTRIGPFANASRRVRDRSTPAKGSILIDSFCFRETTSIQCSPTPGVLPWAWYAALQNA
jgi:hypothetical protein